jgi:hypothetical protein
MVPAGAVYCPNCGDARVAISRGATVGELLVSGLGGMVLALPAFVALSVAGSALFADVGARSSGPAQEFAVSRGSAVFFIFLTLLTLVGVVVVARARMSPPLRVFSLAFFAVMLGLFSICDIFAIGS